MTSHIKCPNCGIYSTNVDYCTNCNTLLSYKKRRELAFAQQEKERRDKEQLRKEQSPSLYKRYKDHRFLLVRIIVKTLHSIWMAFMAVGMFIAWLISTIVA